MSIKLHVVRLLLLLTITVLTGCFSLGRDAPIQRHYVLGGSRLMSPAAVVESLGGSAVGLRQIELAEYLESPLIVVRHGAHQVSYSEFNRWAEDLSEGVNRAIAGYLAGRAPFESIDIVPWPPRTEHDYLIQLHLLRFEGAASEGSMAGDGEAHLLVNWEILDPAGSAVLVRGTTDYRAPAWKVGDYASLVTLLDLGLRELSDDLIVGLQSAASQ